VTPCEGWIGGEGTQKWNPPDSYGPNDIESYTWNEYPDFYELDEIRENVEDSSIYYLVENLDNFIGLIDDSTFLDQIQNIEDLNLEKVYTGTYYSSYNLLFKYLDEETPNDDPETPKKSDAEEDCNSICPENAELKCEEVEEEKTIECLINFVYFSNIGSLPFVSQNQPEAVANVEIVFKEDGNSCVYDPDGGGSKIHISDIDASECVTSELGEKCEIKTVDTPLIGISPVCDKDNCMIPKGNLKEGEDNSPILDFNLYVVNKAESTNEVCIYAGAEIELAGIGQEGIRYNCESNEEDKYKDIQDLTANPGLTVPSKCIDGLWEPMLLNTACSPKDENKCNYYNYEGKQVCMVCKNVNNKFIWTVWDGEGNPCANCDNSEINAAGIFSPLFNEVRNAVTGFVTYFGNNEEPQCTLTPPGSGGGSSTTYTPPTGENGELDGGEERPSGCHHDPGTPIGPCPDFDIEEHRGKIITSDKILDTRDQKFCDTFGDLEKGVDLLIMDSAMVTGGGDSGCWILAEIQKVMDGYKPDLYFRYNDIKHLLGDIELRCETDADCVPSACCHSDSCVHKDLAPDCTDAPPCLPVCMPNTMDCGQGKCICQEGLCVSKIPICENDDECEENELCIDNKCRKACEEQTDCEQGYYCSEDGICIPECEIDTDCSEGNVCIDNKCIQTCESQDECIDGYYCHYNNICLPNCDSDDECSENEVCSDNKCMLTCELEEDCIDGYYCHYNNICLPDCDSNDECSENEVCSDNKCLQTCQIEEDCILDAYYCSEDGICVPECEIDSDCSENEVCSDNKCLQTCQIEEDCILDGYYCHYNNICLPNCDSNDECSEDEECVDKMCRQKCELDEDCISDSYYCHYSDVCLLKCQSDDDCIEGEVCSNNKCMLTCDSEEDCILDGYYCSEENICVPECKNNDDCNDGYYCNTKINKCMILYEKELKQIAGFYFMSKQEIPGEILFDPISLGYYAEESNHVLNSDYSWFIKVDYQEDLINLIENNPDIFGYWMIDTDCSQGYDLEKIYEEYSEITDIPLITKMSKECLLQNLEKEKPFSDIVFFDYTGNDDVLQIDTEMKFIPMINTQGKTAEEIAQITNNIMNKGYFGFVLYPYEIIDAEDYDFINAYTYAFCRAREKYYNVECKYETIYPEKIKIAFTGNQGYDESAYDVIELLKREDPDLVVLTGNFGYDSSSNWINMMDGLSMPIIAARGLYDSNEWTEYKNYLEGEFLFNQELSCSGETSQQMTCTFKDISFSVSSVGVTSLAQSHLVFLENSLNNENKIKFCVWNKANKDMRISNKPLNDNLGLDYYELCRNKGAFIVTGYDMAYARTKLITGFNPITTVTNYDMGPGKTMVFMSGLGGYGSDLFNCDMHENDNWWSSIFTPNYYLNKSVASLENSCSSNDISNFAPGALFITINPDGMQKKARAEFITIDDEVIDTIDINLIN
jgi:hypothetical protein